MTNKPMLSVERELLEVCESALFRLETFVEADREMPIPSMEVLLDAFRRVLAAKPAAPHQCEPVVLIELVENKVYGGMHIAKWDNVGGLKEGLHRLYAEQPAPVANGTTSDKYKAELYDEVWQKARDMGFNNVTDALAKVGAPVAAEHTMRSVMEITQEARGFPVLTSNQCHALAESLNYVARLNGVKP